MGKGKNTGILSHAGGIGKLSESSRKLLLYRLCSLVQSLYPTIKTNPPFPTEQLNVLAYLDLEDRLLFRELLHSLTVLNGQTSCDNDNQLTSTRSDYLNALRLILPGALQLTPRIMDIRDELLSVYGEDRFTYVEACSRLKISLKTLKRSLHPLLAHGLVRKYKPKSGKVMLQLISIQEESSHPIFNQAFEEWQDYLGFVEL